MSDAVPHHPSVSVCPVYRDREAALRWLEAAFGFEPSMVIVGPDDTVMHAEMRFGDGLIMVGSEWSPAHRSPAGMEGKNTCSAHITLTTDVDAHCERARAAGATIEAEPETQFYGDRSYRARDPEGHIWTFSQTVQAMTPAEWDKAAGEGVRTRTRL